MTLLSPFNVLFVTRNNIQLAYDLDEPEEGGIAVNLFPLLLNAQITDQQGSSSR